MKRSDLIKYGLTASVTLATTLAPSSWAEIETTGEPGSPGATTTISGKQLPAPDPKFGGVIKDQALQSKTWWAPRVVPPKDAPNVLLIMTDDVGFGAPSTFGGVIPTPTMDRVAQMGLRYTCMHSTALCSPTRAALITGRNHHSAGFGVVSEQSTGFPGYNSIIAEDKATVGRMLVDNGYSTSWFGKDHNTPTFQSSQLGPFTQWPSGMGFEYFYGFVGGDTSQWQPNLFRNHTQIYPFQGKPPGTWNLETAMADDAIDWLSRINQTDPSKKFFCYYVPGATHAPHHPTQEWVDKIHAMHLFDGGWNKLRDTIFANQKKLGVIPADAKMTPWPDKLLKNWDQCTPDEQKLFIKQVEVYAAFLAYTDNEIGRVINEVEREGKLNDTLIIYISGDNGGSAEGTMVGTPNETASLQGVSVPVEAQLKYFYDVWGTEHTYPHMAIPWTWAFNTPFSWTKQIASHFGGVRQGMAVAWPGHITDAGGIRNQFAHMIDVVPTILEATGIKQPEVVDGIKQSPIEGVSFAYTFPKENANVPSRHHTQYFEMMGDHAIYQDGWVAATRVIRPPWNMMGAVNPDPLNNVTWELFNITKDWTECDDLAAQHPDKVKEMAALFLSEAKKYNVLPMDASVATRIAAPRPSLTAGRSEFVYTRPMVGTPSGAAPSVLNASYIFTADITVPDSGSAEGMLVTQGGRFGGYGFYLLKGKPVFVWNLLALKNVRWEGPEALAPGKHTLVFDFKYDGLGAATLVFNSVSGLGSSGTGVLKVDGKEVATEKMEHTIPILLQLDESFDIGSDTLTGVNDADYQPPFPLTATLDKLTVVINRPKLSSADIEKLKAGEAAAEDGAAPEVIQPGPF